MRESALTLVPVPGDVMPEILFAFKALFENGDSDEPRSHYDDGENLVEIIVADKWIHFIAVDSDE